MPQVAICIRVESTGGAPPSVLVQLAEYNPTLVYKRLLIPSWARVAVPQGLTPAEAVAAAFPERVVYGSFDDYQLDVERMLIDQGWRERLPDGSLGLTERARFVESLEIDPATGLVIDPGRA